MTSSARSTRGKRAYTPPKGRATTARQIEEGRSRLSPTVEWIIVAAVLLVIIGVIFYIGADIGGGGGGPHGG